jgi:hypothetical protein
MTQKCAENSLTYRTTCIAVARLSSFVAAKMALLSDRAAAATRADELNAQICDVRDWLNGRVRRQGDDPAELRIEFDKLAAEQTTLQRHRPIKADTIDRCKAWLEALPPVLEQVASVASRKGADQETARVRSGAEARAHPHPGHPGQNKRLTCRA